MSDTIVALATPFGISAIAKIRISGPLTRTLIRKHLGNKDPATHSAFLANYRSISGRILDQVIVLFFSNGHSHTGEDSMEIDCHGNPLIIRSIIEDLQVAGCRIAEPGEFTKWAYLNHKIDLCQAEAVLDVIHATSESALEISQKQLRGTLSEKIFHFSDILLSLLAMIEARIDFAEEGLEFDDKISNKLGETLKEIEKIIDNHKFRKMLLHGISVAIVGHPNAGKSSLLNALLNEERALVSDIPGTTRDFVSENIIIDGFLIKIIDTAGLRTTDDAIERLGIAKTIENIHAADLCLIVVDQNTPLPLGEAIVAELQRKICILVFNKTDLEENSFPHISKGLKIFPSVFISAKHGTGVDILKSTIANKIRESMLLPQEVTIAINERHREIFQAVHDSIVSAQNILNSQQSYELCASDLRFALETLGYITGKYNTEEMLGKIFDQFCIGK
ncbi:MAG: tRNA uridine-5-carboxymethylaminomethyl(34) synthesis GTPase MnmE [Puniceicoccales bacterium]|jgi:tRNA modification GTPase|nr:tRNA uridine-5-carboxymethylaminomethyl(34) synthesis GTPase MnmE [Puniceicoccales bacterium]